MGDNHFYGNGNNITIIQIVVNPKDDKQINKPKRAKKSFWNKTKDFFAGCGSIVDLFKKLFPIIFLCLTSC